VPTLIREELHMTDSIEHQVQIAMERVRSLDPKSAQPTLVYFDIIGIAWPIRCLLHLHSVDYELIPITLPMWLHVDEKGERVLKNSFTNGHLPLYVDSEVKLNQSNLIMSHLADRHGMAGATQADRYGVLEVMAHAYDALFHWNGLLQIVVRPGIPDEVVKLRLDAFMGEGSWGILTGGYRNQLDGFVRYLDANPARSGYFVGESLTVADLHAFNVLCNWYKAFSPKSFESEYPQLDAFIRRIAAISKVSDYIQNHQEATTWFPLPHVAIRLTTPEELQGLF
jgi:glutathione S-transferase